MIKLFSFLLCIIFLSHANAQQNTSVSKHSVTFKLKLSDVPVPDTLGLVWVVLPYNERTVQHFSAFSKQLNADGLFQQTITFPDSLIGKPILYVYTGSGNKHDLYRNFVLKDGEPEKLDSWGYVDGLASKVKATKMLFIAPNSDDEKEMFSTPYVGVTTDGKPVKNLFPIKKTGYSTASIKKAISSFTATLTSDQKSIAIFPIESQEWRRWHNIEQWQRSGICLEDMTPKQKELIFSVMKESLSARGLQKAKDIMTMEGYLATLVPESKNLGSEKYWFTFFGTPSDVEPYGWQIEGHHLVINYFILGDQIVMTPTFMGSEPTMIDSGKNKGLRTYEAEEKKGLSFYRSLDNAQRKEARLWNTKDFDFNRAEAFRDNEIIGTTGIATTKLSKTQQDALIDMMAEYINNIRDGQAKVKMEEVMRHFKDTRFTWVQSEDIDSPFYYRIHSPVILIEFDHQVPVFLFDPANPSIHPVKTHIHTVVRTPNGNDYGKDLLSEHLGNQAHSK